MDTRTTLNPGSAKAEALWAPAEELPTYTFDRLGKFVRRASALLREGGLPRVVQEFQAPPDIQHNVGTIDHKAARLLNYLRRSGVPVQLSTPPWTPSRLAAAAK